MKGISILLIALGLSAFPGIVGAQVTLTQSAAAPTPGPNDIAFVYTAGGTQNNYGLNYYWNNGSPLGQTFTTGSNPGGYTMTGLTLKTAGGGGGAELSSQTFTLRIYSVSGTTATLLQTYTATSQLLTQGDWLEWSGLNTTLTNNAEYAYTFAGGSGYEQMANDQGNVYSGGQICLIPAAGGAVTYGNGGASYSDATFDVVLALGPASGGTVTLTDIGYYLGSAPTPGPNDIAQLLPRNTPPQNNYGLNYYDNDSPQCGETFTTGSHSAGYVMTSLAIGTAGGGGGGETSSQTYILRIFSVSNTTATLLHTFTATLALVQNDWLYWSGLNVALTANTQYAYSLTDGSPYEELLNYSGNLYPGGQICLIPAAGGTITYGNGGTNYSVAGFDAGLFPNTDPLVLPTQISPPNPVYAGTEISLSAVYSGTPPFTSFVWQTDGGSVGLNWTNLSGSTTNTYSINTSGMTAGTYEYRLIVTGGAGTTTNAPATNILDNASAPFLTANTTITPSTIYVSGNVTMSAAFAGTQPITYQWQFISTNNVTNQISGATNSDYALNGAQYANVGSYFVVASNTVGTFASTPAPLIVVPEVLLTDNGATAPTPGLYDISQLSENGNTGDPDPPVNNYYDNNSEPCGQTFTTGNNSSGYVLNALYIEYGTVNGGHASGVTYTLRLYSISGSTATPLSTYQNNNSAPAIALGDWIEWSDGLTNVLSPNTLYAYTLSASSGYEQMGCASGLPYAGGQIVEVPAAGGTVTYGGTGTYDAAFDVNLVPLGFPVVKSVSISPANSAVNPVYAQTPVTLSVSAIGQSPLTYVWQTDNGSGGATWSNLANSDNSVYSINTASLSSGTYEYQVIVSNILSTVTSPIVTLNLVAASGPVLVSDTTINPSVTAVGYPVTISATFSGTEPIFFQWYFNNGSGFTDIPGATNSTYAIASAQINNSGAYFVAASNAVGGNATVSSTPANLLVTVPGQINVTSAAVVDAGAAAPTPGADDISQLVSEVPSLVPGINYYVNNAPPPGQTFITGTNPPTPAGYPLTSLFVKAEANSVGAAGGTAQQYTLDIYLVEDSSAALITSYTSTNSLAITEGDWIVWSGMTNLLQPNTTYAFSVNNDYGLYGWFKLANDGGLGSDLYTNGQVALLPASGYGAMTFSSDPTIDAAFLVGLTPPSSPEPVLNTTITPANCYAGAPVAMEALFSGLAPISYQWEFISTNNVTNELFGATNTSYMIASMNASNAGSYFLVASNNVSGTPNVVSSAPATLTLVPDPTNFVANFAYSVAGPTTYSGAGVFPSGTFWNTISNTTGDNENAFADDGVTDLYIGFTSTRTWDFANNGGGIGLLEYFMLNQSGTPTTFGLNNLPRGVYNLYLYSCDGHYQKSQTIFSIGAATETATTSTDAGFIQSNNYVLFTNLVVTNGSIEGTWVEGDAEGALNGAQLQLAYSFAHPTVYIWSQPANTEVALGQPASFSVLAFGPPPLLYQWESNGVPIAGATGSTFNIAAATIADGVPNYTVVVSNLSGMVVTSSVANLTVRTSVNNLLWQAYNTSTWDLSTQNWEDTNSLAQAAFQQGDNVTFDSSAYGFTVVLSQMLMPSSVTVNSSLPYDFQGFGYLSWTMNLNLLGSSSLTIETANNYTGNTVLGPGTTLSLLGVGSIGSSTAIDLGTGATLIVTGRSDGTLTVNSGQTLEGNGAFNVNGTVVNDGTLAFKVNKTGGVITNDLLQGMTGIVYGGTLALSLTGQALAAADTIDLFIANNYSGVFTNITPPTPGPGLAWNTNTLTTDGTLRIASGVSTNSTNIVYSVSHGTLNLSWPGDHLGWTLQTNSVSLAATNQWFAYPGSTSVTNVSITITANPIDVFFRLVYP